LAIGHTSYKFSVRSCLDKVSGLPILLPRTINGIESNFKKVCSTSHGVPFLRQEMDDNCSLWYLAIWKI